MWAFGGLYFKRTNPGFSHTLAHTNGKKGAAIVYTLHKGTKDNNPLVWRVTVVGIPVPDRSCLSRFLKTPLFCSFRTVALFSQTVVWNRQTTVDHYIAKFFFSWIVGWKRFVFFGVQMVDKYSMTWAFFGEIFRLYCMRGKSNMFLIIKWNFDGKRNWSLIRWNKN